MDQEELQRVALLTQTVRALMKMAIIEAAEREAIQTMLREQGLLPDLQFAAARKKTLAEAITLIQQVEQIFDGSDDEALLRLLRKYEGPVQ